MSGAAHATYVAMARTALSLAAAVAVLIGAAERARADDPDEVGRAKAQALVTLDRMSLRAGQVHSLLRQARASHRSSREVACVDAALTRADVAVRRGHEDLDRAVEAFARGEIAGGRTAFTRVASSDSLSRLAWFEANACLGRHIEAR